MSLLKRITVSSRVLVPLLIGIGSLVIFYDLLPLLARRVISSPIADLANQFLFWRDYGFGELKEGRFAFWNPYLYSGAPFWWLPICAPLSSQFSLSRSPTHVGHQRGDPVTYLSPRAFHVSLGTGTGLGRPSRAS